MAKFVRHTDGTKIMANENSEAWNLAQGKDANPEALAKHMKKLDDGWRKAEGRKPVHQLTEREKMFEGRIPWNRDILLYHKIPFVSQPTVLD